MLKAFVLCGNYYQYLDYLRENKLDKNEYDYLNDITQTYGIHGIPVIRIGTYWERLVNFQVNDWIY